MDNQLVAKYNIDAEFHTLVDMFYMFFYNNQFTFDEVKSALVFAMNKFTMENGKLNVFPKGDINEKS